MSQFKKYVWGVSPALILAGSAALASPISGIQLGQPQYGGTGCPAGTASATLSPDGQSLSLLFDGYQVEAGGMTGKKLDRKTCNIAIPVTVPQGYSVSIIQVDYRGFNALPAGGSSAFNVEYFFAGSQGPAFSRQFTGPLSQDFLINNRLVAEAVSWSACGEGVTLRTNSSMYVQTNSRNEQAMATVDSADVQASVVYQLQWRRCGDGGSPFPSPAPIPPAPVPAPIPAPIPVPPTQPLPPAPSSACSIQSVRDRFGNVSYRVLDARGNILGEFRDYNSATQAQYSFDRAGRCSVGGWNPGPAPVPPIQPVPPSRNSCQIMTGRNAFGQTIYRVVDRYGAVIYTSTDYSSAVREQSYNYSCR